MSLWNDIPFLRNTTLTALINEINVGGQLLGPSLIPDRQVDTRTSEWESVRGGRNIAPIVAYDAQSPLVRRPGVKTFRAEMLDIREKYLLREADLAGFTRVPGTRDTPFTAQAHIADQLARMRRDVETRKEKMRWDVILTGMLVHNDIVDGQKIAFSLDYAIPSAQFPALTGTNQWDEPTATTTANIVGDFNAAKAVVREATGETVRVAYMNGNTATYINQNEKIREQYLYTDGGSRTVENELITGVISNVRIVTYDEGYKTDVDWEGAFQYFLPDNKVVFWTPSPAGDPLADMASAPNVLADGTIVRGIFAEQWTQPDPTREYIRVGTSVIPRVFHRDWHVVLTVA